MLHRDEEDIPEQKFSLDLFSYITRIKRQKMFHYSWFYSWLFQRTNFTIIFVFDSFRLSLHIRSVIKKEYTDYTLTFFKLKSKWRRVYRRTLYIIRGSSRSDIAYELDYVIVVSEFEIQ